VSTIPEWLTSLGMSQYAERFAKEEIEVDVLSELTDQDLERLGIPLGHGRRMLRAIRELGGPTQATPRVATAVPPDTAERRHLTVMFCDLVWVHRTVGEARSRGFARDHQRLSSLLHGGGRAQRRFRRQVHGRRGARRAGVWVVRADIIGCLLPSFQDACSSRRVRVLDLDPVRASARPVGPSRRFDTIPSSPIVQACRNMAVAVQVLGQ